MSKNMEKVQPFGDVPKTLTIQLQRSLVATRTFSQALHEGKKILGKILAVQATDSCSSALTKMSFCPACHGLPDIQPCSNYCLNVMKGCLAHHAELNDSWDRVVDSLISVGEKLIGPFNLDAVVENIHIEISGAIMNFQDRSYEVTGKVFQDCGRPRLGKRQVGGFDHLGSRSKDVKRTSHAGSGNRRDRREIDEISLDTVVTNIMARLKNTQGFWTMLPSILCLWENPELGSGREPVVKNCWNGQDRGSYHKQVGLAFASTFQC